jgi:NADH dehydrogenase
MDSYLTNIVVLGAGYGGITAALKLSRLSRKHFNIKIHLIDKNPYHTLKTQLHEAAVHKNEVAIPIERIIAKKNITFHCGTINKIDLESKRIFTEDENISFRYLVVALGSKANFYNVEGLNDYSFPLQSYDDAQKIYNHISQLCAKAASEQNTDKRKEKLTFVVGGGGLSGVEFAAELSEHVKQCINNYRVNEKEISIVLVEAADKILPNVSDYVRSRIEDKLEAKDINVLTKTGITRVTEDEVFFSNSNFQKTKTLVWTGGIRASGLIKESGFKTGPGGRVIVNEYLQAKDYPYVYALGDNAIVINPITKQPVPAAAQFALQQGRLAAQNIYNAIYGYRKISYHPRVWGEFISLGKHLAAGWIALPLSKKLGFIGFLAHLLNRAIKEKHIFLLRKESRKWIIY